MWLWPSTSGHILPPPPIFDDAVVRPGLQRRKGHSARIARVGISHEGEARVNPCVLQQAGRLDEVADALLPYHSSGENDEGRPRLFRPADELFKIDTGSADEDTPITIHDSKAAKTARSSGF